MGSSSKVSVRQQIFSICRLATGTAMNLSDSSPLLGRYLLAVVCVVGAVLVRFALAPVLAKQQILFSFTIAITVAALTGTGPGLFATALSVIAALFFFVEPYFSFAVNDVADAASLLVLGGVGACISVMCRFFRRQGPETGVLAPV